MLSFALIFLWDQNKSEVSNLKDNLIVLILVFAVTAFNSITYNSFVLYMNELLPTQIRVIAIGVIYITGGIAILVIPSMINLCLRFNFPIMIVFTAFAVFSSLAYFRLPETFGQKPPEIIEELLLNKEEQQQLYTSEVSITLHWLNPSSNASFLFLIFS